jgi:hypothetical protein
VSDHTPWGRFKGRLLDAFVRRFVGFDASASAAAPPDSDVIDGISVRAVQFVRPQPTGPDAYGIDVSVGGDVEWLAGTSMSRADAVDPLADFQTGDPDFDRAWHLFGSEFQLSALLTPDACVELVSWIRATRGELRDGRLEFVKRPKRGQSTLEARERLDPELQRLVALYQQITTDPLDRLADVLVDSPVLEQRVRALTLLCERAPDGEATRRARAAAVESTETFLKALGAGTEDAIRAELEDWSQANGPHSMGVRALGALGTHQSVAWLNRLAADRRQSIERRTAAHAAAQSIIERQPAGAAGGLSLAAPSDGDGALSMVVGPSGGELSLGGEE